MSQHKVTYTYERLDLRGPEPRVVRQRWEIEPPCVECGRPTMRCVCTELKES